MAFITIVESDEAFAWQPTDDSTGDHYESTFQLRIVADEVLKQLRKRFTKQVWNKKSRQMEDKLDDYGYTAALVDHAIVGWSGVKAAKTGAELECTPELKTRLPEKWKAEILRLCAAKEAGDAIVAAEEEKKLSRPTSIGKATSSSDSPAV